MSSPPRHAKDINGRLPRLLEWLDAVRAYYEAETTYLNLWAEQMRRRVALEQLAGIPLF